MADQLVVSNKISIPDEEIEISAIRAQGAGGQHLNKVSTAVHLRFDIHTSSLPEAVQQRLLALRDRRITRQGVVVIKAGNSRSQDKNRQQARMRLAELVRRALTVPKKRRPTGPTHSSRVKRLETKTRRSRLKGLRRRIESEE